MLLTIAAILAVLWILGIVVHIGGALINVIIVVAVIMVIMHFLKGRPTNRV